MKIDVCVVSRNLPSIDFISHIRHNVPTNEVIWERTANISVARFNAIKKVQTPFFAFIDDDVTLTEKWFPAIMKEFNKDVGAVQGWMNIKGLGEKWDDAVNSIRERRELKEGERGFTHNVVIRTTAVEDWVPLFPIKSWEDYLISQHVLKKGYKWIITPVEAYHRTSLKKVFNNARWAEEGRVELFGDRIWELIRILAFLVRIPFRKESSYLKLYRMIQNLGRIYGCFD